MKYLYLLCLLFCIQFSYSQLPKISDNATASVITIGSGDKLYEIFGHNAFRIKDDNFDIVFDYGNFSFETGNFYLKFARGKLPYTISAAYYNDMVAHYIKNNRTVKEQVLNLSPQQVKQLYGYLVNNYRPENRTYLYDFFYNNCATKIKDVLKEIFGNSLSIKAPSNLPNYTFRELLYLKLDKNTWSSLGIDLALGSVIDKPAAPEHYMFLPDYIYSFFKNSSINNKPLVASSSVIYEQKERSSSRLLISPLFIFSIISLLIIYLTYKDYKNNTRTKWLDVLLFIITGIAGIIMLLLWFATDHTGTAQNYNVLWAFPLNLLVIQQLFKQQSSPWFSRYIKFLIILLVLLTFHWITGVQVFAISLIPLLIALVLRYVFLVSFSSKQK